MCWNWRGKRTFYVLTGLLYNTFLFLLRLPKYAWLFIYSGTRANQMEQKENGVKCRLSLNVADVGKTSRVIMAKTRQPNGRMHRDYPVVHLTITEQKFSSWRRKSRQIMQSIETTETFDFIIIVPSNFAFYTFVGSLYVEMKNSLLNCWTEEAVTPGMLLKFLMTLNRMIHHPTPLQAYLAIATTFSPLFLFILAAALLYK